MIAPPPIKSYNPILGKRLKDFIRYTEVQQLAYKVLDLQRQRPDDFRSLAILSFLPSEGRTLLTAVLAMAVAEASRQRTLVVDTTTFHNPKSLVLRQCVDPEDPLVEHMSLADHRNGTNGHKKAPGTPVNGNALLLASPTDHALISQVTEDGAKQYGLVLLDTSPLSARNKNNLSPLLVARHADAAILLTSRKSLQSPELPAHIQLLTDAGAHLAGVVSNEEVFR